MADEKDTSTILDGIENYKTEVEVIEGTPNGLAKYELKTSLRRRTFSFKTGFQVVGLLALGVTISAGFMLRDQANNSASIKIGGARIDRSGDIGPGIVKGALSILGMSGQASVEDQQFISNLGYSPDQLESQILDIRKQYPTPDGQPMENVDDLLLLAGRGTNDSESLSAASACKRLARILITVQARTDGEGNLESLQRQMRINNGRVIDKATFFKVDESGNVVRKDGGSMDQVNWLLNMDKTTNR